MQRTTKKWFFFVCIIINCQTILTVYKYKLSELSDNSTGPSLSLRARILILSSVLEIFFFEKFARTRVRRIPIICHPRGRGRQRRNFQNILTIQNFRNFSTTGKSFQFFPVTRGTAAYGPYGPIKRHMRPATCIWQILSGIC